MEINFWVLIAQAINFWVLLFLFKWLVWDKISKFIVARRWELEKAQDATKAYEETMAKAQIDKKALIDEALAHKNKVMQEASQIAERKVQEILSDAEKKAKVILYEATEKSSKIEKDLKENFSAWVKNTSKLLVKKLINNDVDLQDKYIDALVKEFSS